jgi:hypothetical protein
MATCWSAPTTKHAFRLSVISLLVTILAALAGILLYSVSFVSLLHILIAIRMNSFTSENVRLTVS